MEPKLIAAYKALRDIATDPSIDKTPSQQIVYGWMTAIRDQLIQIANKKAEAQVDAALV